MRDATRMPTIHNKPNPALGHHARRIWSLLRPRDVVGGRMARKGRDFDGGYIMLDHALEHATAYSLGIADDVSWDLDMAALGCHVFQYDHTIDAPPREHPLLHWHGIGIGGRASEAPPLRTIAELIEINGHRDATDLILKMDIEGAEWEALDTIEPRTLAQFSQIICEIHWLHHLDQTHHFRRIVDGLRKLSRAHQLVHAHANNYGGVVLAGGVFLPETFELTYVRARDHAFSDCARLFPTELDMPCDHAAADYFLGAIGAL